MVKRHNCCCAQRVFEADECDGDFPLSNKERERERAGERARDREREKGRGLTKGTVGGKKKTKKKKTSVISRWNVFHDFQPGAGGGGQHTKRRRRKRRRRRSAGWNQRLQEPP